MILYSKGFLHLFDASTADALTVEIYGVVCAVAEDAGGLILLQDDAIVVGEDFDGILLLDIQNLSYFNGKHDSSQLVNLTDYSRRFHDDFSFFIPKMMAHMARIRHNARRKMPRKRRTGRFSPLLLYPILGYLSSPEMGTFLRFFAKEGGTPSVKRVTKTEKNGNTTIYNNAIP